MADQDFTIKVVTTADTTGLKQTEAELDFLIKKNVEAGRSLASATELAKAGLLFDPEKNIFQKVRVESAEAAAAVSKVAKDLQGFTGEGFLAGAAKATKELSEHAAHGAVNLGKARAEAIILARELASGVPPLRTLSSLLGSLGIPIAIAGTAAFALAKAFGESAENIKRAREEQEKLSDELENHLRAAENISDTEDWNKANRAIEDQIRLLERRLYLATDPKERESIFRQLQYAEQEKRLLPEVAAKALQRAAAERAIREEIRAQVEAIKELGAGYERARALSEQNAAAAKELRNIQKQAQEDVIKEKADRGEITQIDALTKREKLRADQAAEDHAASQKQIDERLKSNTNEFSNFDAQSKEAHKTLEERRALLERIQFLKTLPEAALEPEEKEQVENIKAYEAALREAEATTAAIDENRRKAAATSDAEIGKLLREKEILDQIYQAEEARNKAIFERQKKAVISEGIKEASAQTKAVLMNEQAAQKAREAGLERQADLYQKSAQQLEKGMTPAQRAELEKLREAAKGPPPGRAAGPGESQALVDQMERNRINFERQLKGEKPTGQGENGNQAIIDAITRLRNDLVGIWR